MLGEKIMKKQNEDTMCTIFGPYVMDKNKKNMQELKEDKNSKIQELYEAIDDYIEQA